MKLGKKIIGLTLSAVLALGMFPAGAMAASSEEDGADVESILAEMTLEEKIGQMMAVSFRRWEEVPDESTQDAGKTVENSEENPKVPVTELNDAIRDCIRERHFGAAVLFAENVEDQEQTLRLIADMQNTNQEGGGLPMLIAADQEGGNVARLTCGTTGPGSMAITATGETANAECMASIYGEELSLLGINTNFAPVLDVNNNPSNPIIGVRSFSDDPEIVVEYGLAFLKGLQETGTIATLKHFPGHGNTDTDSHTGLPCIDSTYEELKELELIPFQAAFDAGADMLMTAHIQYPQIETETYTSIDSGEEIFLPATMSKAFLTHILRGEMGFEGVIATDSLEMDAISKNFSIEDTLTLTINAGANLLLLSPVYDMASFQKLEETIDTAVRLAEDGTIEMERVDDSVRRILTLKEKYGLLEQTDFTVTEDKIRAAVEGVGSEEHRAAAMDITRAALTLVKNEGNVFPLDIKEGETTLILLGDTIASRVATPELALQMLQEEDPDFDASQVTVMVNDAENGEECVEAAKAADHVILLYRDYSAATLDPSTDDGFSSAVFDRVIEERHAEGKQVLFISCQLPYDAARFIEADAILLTYNSSPMRELPPEHGKGSAYAPNMLVGLLAAFEGQEITGTLPVNIPELNEAYQETEEILFAA